MKTDKGDITCEHVVSATGNFARQTGAMVGLDMPVIPVEHQYIVTEPHPAIVERQRQGLPEMGVLRESDSSWYMREENGGLLLGPYEKGAPACYVDGPAPKSEYELFQEDLDRLAPHIETAIARVPAFGEVGVKKVYNGAIAYTPDGSPIIGPAWGRAEFLAERGPFLRRHRRRRRRLAACRMDRRGRADHRHAGRRPAPLRALRLARLPQGEERGSLSPMVFTVHYPDEERVAARPLKTRALLRPHEGARRRVRHGLWLGAAGLVRAAGLRALGEADLAKPDVLLNENHPPAEGRRADPREMELPPLQLFPLRRRGMPATCATTSACRTCRAFAKARSPGRAPRNGWTGILANRIPKKVGRIALCHLLSQERRRPLGVHGLSHRRRRASISSPPAPASATTTTS